MLEKFAVLFGFSAVGLITYVWWSTYVRKEKFPLKLGFLVLLLLVLTLVLGLGPSIVLERRQ